MNESELVAVAAVGGAIYFASGNGSASGSTSDTTDPEDVTDEDVYPNVSGIDSGSSGGGLL